MERRRRTDTRSGDNETVVGVVSAQTRGTPAQPSVPDRPALTAETNPLVQQAYVERLNHLARAVGCSTTVKPAVLDEAAQMTDPQDTSHARSPTSFPHRRVEMWSALREESPNALAPALAATLAAYRAYNPLAGKHEENYCVLAPLEAACAMAGDAGLDTTTRELALLTCAAHPVTAKGRSAVAALLAQTPEHERLPLHKALAERLGLS